jgi:hypothetical protein
MPQPTEVDVIGHQVYAGSENAGPHSGYTGRRGRETRVIATGGGQMSGAFIEIILANGQANRDVVFVEGCGAVLLRTAHTGKGAGRLGLVVSL